MSNITLWKSGNGIQPAEAGKRVCSFLDTATTSFGRATHYNTREEQRQAEMAVHGDLFTMSRDVYLTLLLLPGVADHARQIGIGSLLSNPRLPNADVFLDARLEREVLVHLVSHLPPPRMFKLFDAFRGRGGAFGVVKANNARTRKLILSSLIGSKRLDLWAVKYRSKMTRVLAHAWGQRRASIIGSILQKDRRRWKSLEREIIKDHVFKFRGANQERYVVECLAFVFGKREGLTIKLLKAFVDARVDIKAGERLPTEVLEGIRSTFHKEIKPEEIIKLKAKSGTMTTHEKRTVQKRAKAAGAEVKMDPLRYDPVELYIYAFENGADEKVFNALDEKAVAAAAALPVNYRKVGIVVDGSASMAGDRTQHLRPLATTLALRDMLQKAAEQSEVVYCGGVLGDDQRLLKPQGDTSLAEGLLHVLGRSPEAVYVLSDGYENAPAGRFQDVLVAAREIGIETPVFHMNPVFAAEGQAVRQLTEQVEGASTMPVRSPAALATTMLRGLLETDPEVGINTLIRSALKGSTIDRLALIGGE
jgi:hypothetical protein